MTIRDYDRKAARAWAIANNQPVPKRGPLRQEVIDAYLLAMCWQENTDD